MLFNEEMCNSIIYCLRFVFWLFLLSNWHLKGTHIHFRPVKSLSFEFIFILSSFPSPRWEGSPHVLYAKPSLAAGFPDLDSAKHCSTCISEPPDSSARYLKLYTCPSKVWLFIVNPTQISVMWNLFFFIILNIVHKYFEEENGFFLFFFIWTTMWKKKCITQFCCVA